MLLAAHGTRSAAGSATTAALAAAVAAARPHIPVSTAFLDVADPPLSAALDALGDQPTVVVPLLLAAGYHVISDIPAVVAGRAAVRVARHLGPDPVVVSIVAERLAAARPDPDVPVLLAAIESSRPSARAEVRQAADRLAEMLRRPVTVLPLGGELRDTRLPAPVAVATYLLAEGGFLDVLRDHVGAGGVVADPLGTHPALVELVWSRYDEATCPSG